MADKSNVTVIHILILLVSAQVWSWGRGIKPHVGLHTRHRVYL